MPTTRQKAVELLRPGWRRSLLLTLLVVLAGYAIYWFIEQRRLEALPPLPDLNLREEDSQPAVQRQLRAAHDAARNAPTHAGFNARLGMVFQAYGYYQAAASCYRRAHALEPDFGAAYLLGLALEVTGDRQGAVAALQDALRINPRYGPAALKLAELHREAGDLASSRTLLEDLLKQAPQSPFVHYEYGRLLAASAESQSAIEHLQQAITLSRAAGREFGPAYYALGQAYRASGEGAAAETQLALYELHRDVLPPGDDPVLLAVEQLRQDSLGRLKSVRHLMDREAFEQAGELLQRILAEEPEHVGAHANFIVVAGKLGDLEKARRHYRAALRENPNWAQVHYRFGAVLAEQGSLEEARTVLQRAVASNPHYVPPRVQLGHILERLGERTSAEDQYRLALRDEPQHWQANALLGRQLIRSGDFREAIEHLERIELMDADKTSAVRHSIAVAYLGLGDTRSAHRYLEAARTGAQQGNEQRLLEAIDKELARLEAGGADR